MMKKVFLCFAVLATLAFGPGVDPANALLLLSGDSNITNPLTGSFGGPIDSGNQQFFLNILQGEDNVVVLGSTPPQGGSVNFSDTDINTFYNSVSGVTSTLISGTVTAALLASADLFIAPLPDDAFTASELTDLQSFLAVGGSVFFLGENSAFSTQNAYINSALASFGSGMSIVNGIFDSGFNTATGSQIATDSLTTGISTFKYGAPSPVLGGTTLFLGQSQQRFVAYETTSQVPEPATILLLGFGMLGLAGARKKRKA